VSGSYSRCAVTAPASDAFLDRDEVGGATSVSVQLARPLPRCTFPEPTAPPPRAAVKNRTQRGLRCSASRKPWLRNEPPPPGFWQAFLMGGWGSGRVSVDRSLGTCQNLSPSSLPPPLSSCPALSRASPEEPGAELVTEGVVRALNMSKSTFQPPSVPRHARWVHVGPPERQPNPTQPTPTLL